MRIVEIAGGGVRVLGIGSVAVAINQRRLKIEIAQQTLLHKGRFDVHVRVECAPNSRIEIDVNRIAFDHGILSKQVNMAFQNEILPLEIADELVGMSAVSAEFEHDRLACDVFVVNGGFG